MPFSRLSVAGTVAAGDDFARFLFRTRPVRLASGQWPYSYVYIFAVSAFLLFFFASALVGALAADFWFSWVGNTGDLL